MGKSFLVLLPFFPLSFNAIIIYSYYLLPWWTYYAYVYIYMNTITCIYSIIYTYIYIYVHVNTCSFTCTRRGIHTITVHHHICKHSYRITHTVTYIITQIHNNTITKTYSYKTTCISSDTQYTFQLVPNYYHPHSQLRE